MQPGRPEKGQKMFMKMICKEKDGSANEGKRQAEELNREFYVIDPEEFADKVGHEFTQEDPEPESPMSKVIAFLAEKSADRFDYMADGMEMIVLKEIVYRIEHTDPETAVVMLQSMFMAKGLEAAAVDLDILNVFSEYDADTYETFIDELFDTEIFNQFLVSNWLDEAFGKVGDQSCLS